MKQIKMETNYKHNSIFKTINKNIIIKIKYYRKNK